jgi:Chloroplast envelope transporter
VPQLDHIITFNRQLDALASDPDVVPGLGRTSVWGGKYDSASGGGKTRELRTLFRVFLEERLAKDKTVCVCVCRRAGLT